MLEYYNDIITQGSVHIHGVKTYDRPKYSQGTIWLYPKETQVAMMLL